MINVDVIKRENIKEYNPNWPHILDHTYHILITTGSRFGKINGQVTKKTLIYFHAKDQYEVNYQLLINERKGVSLKHYEDSKAFIEYSNNMGDIYKNIEEFSLNKECKTLIVFDDMIAHMLSNKNFSKQ